MADKPVFGKLMRTLHNAANAWWVLLLIVGYSALAWRFLGTSCILASTTGLPCPGCGSTRAFIALLHGDIIGSLRYHPLMIPSVILICIYFVVWLFRDSVPRCIEKTLLALTVAVFILYFVRMLLMFPHDAPMTYNNDAILPRIIKLFYPSFSVNNHLEAI